MPVILLCDAGKTTQWIKIQLTDMNLPWKFFQAATLVSSRTFKKERPGGTHKDKSTGIRLKWFSFAVKKQNKKKNSFSFISSDQCSSPLGLTLMSSWTHRGMQCGKCPLRGYCYSRAHRGCNMRGRGICTQHHGTSCLGSTHLVYLQKRQFANWSSGETNDMATFNWGTWSSSLQPF